VDSRQEKNISKDWTSVNVFARSTRGRGLTPQSESCIHRLVEDSLTLRYRQRQRPSKAPVTYHLVSETSQRILNILGF
jgi:hypothetical protein